MKKSRFLIILVLLAFLLSGCSNSSESKEEVKSNGETVDTTKMQVMHCTRSASASKGVEVKLNYDLYYTGEILNLLRSEEKIISSSEESLTLYEDAYKKIKSNYEGLEYYDQEIVRGDTTVTNTITINYDKIDVDRLLEIEGEEDNIIENGKAKVDAWVTLAKKFGTTCEDAKESEA